MFWMGFKFMTNSSMPWNCSLNHIELSEFNGSSTLKITKENYNKYYD